MPIRSGHRPAATMVFWSPRLQRSGDRLVGVLALGGLLGDAEHRSDLRPWPLCASSGSNGRVEFVLDMAPLIDEFGDLTQGIGIDRTKVFRIDVVGPTLEVGCSFLSCGTHCFPNPFRNFFRARMAWITAVPSSSVTTPNSNASMSTHEAERRITRPSTHVDESAQNVQERADSPHS